MALPEAPLGLSYCLSTTDLENLLSGSGYLPASVLNHLLQRLVVESPDEGPRASPPPLVWDTGLYAGFVDSGDRRCFCARVFDAYPRSGLWVIPIFLDVPAGQHFIVAILSWADRRIAIRDSLTALFAGACREVFANLQLLVRHLADGSPWTTLLEAVPQQSGADCGLHMVVNTASIVRPDAAWPTAKISAVRYSWGILLLALSTITFTKGGERSTPPTEARLLRWHPEQRTPAGPSPAATLTGRPTPRPATIPPPNDPPAPASAEGGPPPPQLRGETGRSTTTADPPSGSGGPGVTDAQRSGTGAFSDGESEQGLDSTPLPHAPRPPAAPRSRQHVCSINVGPIGVHTGITTLQTITAKNPSVVFVSDLRAYDAASTTGQPARKLGRYLRGQLPGYVPFVSLSGYAARAGGTGIILHRRLALRAAQLNLDRFLRDAPRPFRKVLQGRCTAVRTLPLEGDESTVWVACYAPCSQSELQPLFYAALGELERRLVAEGHQQIIFGGDFNATLSNAQRHHYSTTAHESADSIFRAFVERSTLKALRNPAPTWQSSTHCCTATLDHFLLKQPEGCKVRVVPSDHPRLDHLQLWLDLSPAAGGELPRYVPPLGRPPQICVGKLECKGFQQEVVKETLAAFEGWAESDCIARDLRSFTDTINQAAEEVLGVTEPRSEIPHRDRRQRLLLRLMKDLKTGLREAHALRGRAVLDRLPSALLAAYKTTIRPRPRDPLSDFMANADARIAAIQERLKSVVEEHRDRIRRQRQLSVEKYVARCREAMTRPNSKEIQRLLGKEVARSSLYAIKSGCPDTVVVKGPPPSALFVHSPDGSSKASGLTTTQIHEAIVSLPPGSDVVVSREGPTVVTATDDLLAAWEYEYARQSTTTRWTCSRCQGHKVLHLPLPASGTSPRRVETMCLTCCRPAEHREPPLPTSVDGIERHNIAEILNRPFTIEDLNARLDTLSRGKSALPGSVKHELLSLLPPSLRRRLLDLLNRVVAGGPGTEWKQALVKLLPKDGDTLDIGGFRPITLLDSVQKVFTSLLEDRLRQAAEKYGLLGATQEGFRHRRSCGRQVLTLRYLIGRIKARNLSAFVGYLDFKSAFDSPDVAVMIRWLELTGFQGCEILRHLYDGVQLVIDTAVGPTAPISKSRGTAQGDGLSPILFDLVIAVLLRRLAAANLGLKVDETRIGSLFFADDAAVVTTSLGQMQTALDITSKFEDDSGMRLNVPKTKLTGWDYRRNVDLSGCCLTLKYRDTPLPAASVLPGGEPFKYLGCRMALAPKVGCRAQRENVIADASQLARILSRHVYTAPQGLAVARMVLESSFAFSAALADWDEPSLRRLTLAWARAYKAGGKLARGCAGCLLTWPQTMGAAPFQPPHAVLLQSALGEVGRLVAFQDHTRTLAQQEVHNLFSMTGTSDLGLVGRFLVLEPHPGPVAALLAIAARLRVHVSLPEALTPRAQPCTPPGSPSWLSLFFSNTTGQCDVKEAFRRFRPTLSAMTRFNNQPGHFTPQQVTQYIQDCLPARSALDAPPEALVPPLAPAAGACQRTIDFPEVAGGVAAPRAPREPPTLVDHLATVGFLENGAPLRGQVYASAKVSIRDFANRREEIQHILNGLPPLFLSMSGLEALTAPDAPEPEVIEACSKVMLYHDKHKSRPKYLDPISKFFREASLPKPGPLPGTNNQYDCDVVAIRLARMEDGRFRQECKVVWMGWGDEGAKWRPVRGITASREPYLKAKLDAFLAASPPPPTPDRPPPIATVSSWKWGGAAPPTQDPGCLSSALVTVTLRPVTLVRTQVAGYTIRHRNGVSSVLQPDAVPTAGLPATDRRSPTGGGKRPADARRRAGEVEPAEGAHWDDDQAGGWDEFLATPPPRPTETVVAGPEEQEPLFSLNTGRLGWLLSEYTDEPDPLTRIHQLTHNLAERERSHPVLSQQFQELLVRATQITHVKGLCPISVWAGLSHFTSPGSQVKGVLWFADQEPDELTVDTFCVDHKDLPWIIVFHTKSEVPPPPRGMELVSAVTGLQALQVKGMWHEDKTTTKRSVHPISVWCSPDLAPLLTGRLDDLDSLLTTTGKVGLSRLDAWKRELRWTEAGCAYNMQDSVALGATDGSEADGREGSGAVWFEPGDTTARTKRSHASGRQKVFRAEARAVIMILSTVPLDTELCVLVDCQAVLDGILGRCRTWKRFRQYSKIDADLFAELDSCLLLRQAGGTKTHFVKVRSHRSDPLNEAADTEAEAATVPERDIELNLYPHLATIVQGASHCLYRHVRKEVIETCCKRFSDRERLRKRTAELKRIAGGNAPDLPTRNVEGLNNTETFLHYDGVGREYLGRFLSGPRTEAKRHLLQSVGGIFPTNFYLFDRMRKHPTGNCQCGAAETMTHIQCWCPQLRCNRIQVHHEIWRGVCDSIVEATSQWCYLPEQEMGKRLPEAANGGAAADEWEAMRSALPSKLSKQRPDGLFLNWSSRIVVVGEFSRRMDRRPDECTEINTIKKTRYQALLDSLALHLTGWTVLWAPFSVGVHGTVIKQDWTAALAALGVPHDKWEPIMADAARRALDGHGAMLDGRRAATNNNINFSAGAGGNPPSRPSRSAPSTTTGRGRRNNPHTLNPHSLTGGRAPDTNAKRN